MRVLIGLVAVLTLASAADAQTNGPSNADICRADLDASGVVDIADVNIVNQAYRTRIGQPAFNPQADFDGDGAITLADRVFVTSKVGLQCVADNPPPPPPPLPVVALTTPQSGLLTSSPSHTITGTVSDTTIETGILRVNGVEHALAIANGQFSYAATLGEGVNRLVAQATNATGTGTSAEVVVTVDTRPPVLTATVPGSARPGATVPISAAADDVSGIADITFLLNAAAAGNGTASPSAFSFVVPPDAVGGALFAVELRATDNAGNAAVIRETVTVEGTPDALAPTVLLQMPAQATAGEVLPITASAQDDGELIRLTLGQDGNMLKQVAVAPFATQHAFTVPEDAEPGETFEFVAQAIDASNNVGAASAQLTVVPATTPTTELQISVTQPPSPTFLPSTVLTGTIGSDAGVIVHKPVPFIAELATTAGRQGEQLDVVIRGANTHFDPALSQATFGAGITVESLAVQHESELVARIRIAEDAPLGPRLVVVSTGTEEAFLLNAFNVHPGVGTLSGRLVDLDGTGLANAQVCVPGAAVCTLTDDTGAFTLVNVPTTTTRFVVSAPGFQDRTGVFALQIGQTAALGAIALNPSQELPPPPPPPGAPVITPAMATVFGRGAAMVQEGGDLQRIKKLVIDTIVAVGGTELGVLDANGQQINPAMNGPGFASLLDRGADDLAQRMAGAEFTTLGELLMACLLSLHYDNVPAPSVVRVLAGFQTAVNAAWANPDAVSSPLLMALFNQGRTISPTPPQLTLDTPLNALQSYLIVSTWFAFIHRNLPTGDDDQPPAAALMTPPARRGLLARLGDAVRSLVGGRATRGMSASRLPRAASALPMARIDGRPFATAARRGTTARARTASAQNPPDQWPSLMWETVLAETKNTLPDHLRNGAVQICQALAPSEDNPPLMTRPGCSEVVKLTEMLVSTQVDLTTQASSKFTQFFTEQANPATATRIQQQFQNQTYQDAWRSARDEARRLGRQQAFANFSSEFVQGVIAKQAGDIVNLILRLEAEVIIESLRPQPPVITRIEQVNDPETGLPLPKVRITFQRSVNDRGDGASEVEHWWYELWRAGAGVNQQRVNANRFAGQEGERELVFEDEPVPEGAWSYQVVAVRLVGDTVLEHQPNAADAFFQATAGLVPSANFTTPGSTFEVPGGRKVSIGGVGVDALKTVLEPVALIFRGVRQQRSLMSDALGVYVSSRPAPPRPPASLAVDPFSNSVFLSIPVTRNIFKITPFGVTSFADTNFAFPNQVGLAIDSRGSLYSANAASMAKFGGRVFRFQQPDGRRDHVGNINKYSFLLQFAHPADAQALTVGPSSTGEALYVADGLANAIKRMFVPHAAPPGVPPDGNIAQIVARSDRFAFGPGTTMAFRGDGSLFVNVGPEIFRVTPDGDVDAMFDASGGAASPFFDIGGLAFDVFSNLYVADAALGTITMIPAMNNVPGMAMAGLSEIARKKLTVTRGLRRPSELKLAPDDHGLVLFDQERAVVFVRFGASGQVVDAAGQPLVGAEVLARDLGRATVTDGDGIYVLPGLLQAGASSAVDLTVKYGGKSQTFRVFLDPRQHNIADLTFDPPSPPPPSDEPVPPPPPPPPDPIEVTIEDESTAVELRVPVPRIDPPSGPPPPEPGTVTCPRAAFLRPAHRSATIASPAGVQGFVSGPGVANGFIVVNGAAQPAAIVDGQFNGMVALQRGENVLAFALPGSAMKAAGCADPRTPDDAVVVISGTVNVFHDTSPEVLRQVRAERGFDAAIVGRLVDQDTNLPLVGAHLDVPGTGIRAETDADGVFQLNLPLGGVNFSREVPFDTQASLEPFAEAVMAQGLGSLKIGGVLGGLQGQTGNLLKRLLGEGSALTDLFAKSLEAFNAQTVLTQTQTMLGTLGTIEAQNPPSLLAVDLAALRQIAERLQTKVAAGEDPPRVDEAVLQDQIKGSQQALIAINQQMADLLRCLHQSTLTIIKNLQGNGSRYEHLGLVASRSPFAVRLPGLGMPAAVAAGGAQASPCTTRAQLIDGLGEFLVKEEDARQVIGPEISESLNRFFDGSRQIMAGMLARLQAGADPTPADATDLEGVVEAAEQRGGGGVLGNLLRSLGESGGIGDIIGKFLQSQEGALAQMQSLAKDVERLVPPANATPKIETLLQGMSGLSSTILARLKADQDKQPQDVQQLRDLLGQAQELVEQLNQILINIRESQQQMLVNIRG